MKEDLHITFEMTGCGYHYYCLTVNVLFCHNLIEFLSEFKRVLNLEEKICVP